jgi:hypothetical protein
MEAHRDPKYESKEGNTDELLLWIRTVALPRVFLSATGGISATTAGAAAARARRGHRAYPPRARRAPRNGHNRKLIRQADFPADAPQCIEWARGLRLAHLLRGSDLRVPSSTSALSEPGRRLKKVCATRRQSRSTISSVCSVRGHPKSSRLYSSANASIWSRSVTVKGTYHPAARLASSMVSRWLISSEGDAP